MDMQLLYCRLTNFVAFFSELLQASQPFVAQSSDMRDCAACGRALRVDLDDWNSRASHPWPTKGQIRGGSADRHRPMD
ncbi:hypothetical protein [Sinorhizobium fredii]|uniref:hypothetical protein n=1 Tax=Rhizobium fredii TaxID=380 RepID=UPI0004B0E43E|nr:hypothetical protein [Sinorhizobium fredii]ASY73649.1 hypothetical protein SF83666_a40610 [Sinorhizobium fredii CCBAU 83666]